MSEPQKTETEETPAEAGIPELPSDLDTVDEIHLPGDEEKAAAAEAAAGEAAPQAEVQQEVEAEPATSRLGQFEEQVYAGQEKPSEDAPDPRDVALEEARQRERAQLEARIQDLKEARAQPVKAEEAPVDPAASRQERLDAAAKVLKKRWDREDLTVDEQVTDLVGTIAEVVTMEREAWNREELTPIREKQKAREFEEKKEAYTKAFAAEAEAGLKALEARGGTAQEIAQQFRQGGMENSYLGVAIGDGWDKTTQALPPNLGSRQVVEAMGIAVAAEIDQHLDGKADGGAPGAAASGPSGIVPKARRGKTDIKTTEDEAAAEKLLEETGEYMEDAFSRLGHDKLFG